VSVVLVTVTGPSGQRDLAVPADAPTGLLLGPLVKLLDAQAGTAAITGPPPPKVAWELRSAAGAPIPAGATLPEAGIVTGACLQLTRVHPAGDPAPTTAREPTPPPVAAGRVELPARSLIARWSAARRALLAPTPPGPAQAGEAWHGRWRQAGQAWQAAGYLARLRGGVADATPAGPVTIAVLAPTSGVGVTTVTRLLAATLTDLGVGPVLVVGLPGGPRPHPDGQAAAAAAPIVLVDAGPGLGTLAAHAAVDAADQLVIAVDPDPVTASRAVRAAGPLLAAGRPLTLVVNHPDPRPGPLDLARLAGLLPSASGPLAVPHEPAAAERLAGAGSWPRPWRRAGLELAWLLVGAWARPDQARPPPTTRPQPHHPAT
jgi:WXG100 protein secretion system (Wss), protein YukD